MLAATGPAPLPGGGQVTAANAARLTMKDGYGQSAPTDARPFAGLSGQQLFVRQAR